MHGIFKRAYYFIPCIPSYGPNIVKYRNRAHKRSKTVSNLHTAQQEFEERKDRKRDKDGHVMNWWCVYQLGTVSRHKSGEKMVGALQYNCKQAYTEHMKPILYYSDTVLFISVFSYWSVSFNINLVCHMKFIK